MAGQHKQTHVWETSGVTMAATGFRLEFKVGYEYAHTRNDLKAQLTTSATVSAPQAIYRYYSAQSLLSKDPHGSI